MQGRFGEKSLELYKSQQQSNKRIGITYQRRCGDERPSRERRLRQGRRGGRLKQQYLWGGRKYMEELVRNRWKGTSKNNNTTYESAWHTRDVWMTRSAIGSGNCVECYNKRKGNTPENLEKVSILFKTSSECRYEQRNKCMRRFEQQGQQGRYLRLWFVKITKRKEPNSGIRWQL